VLKERLVPEGDCYLARAGRLRINIQDTNHDSWRAAIVDLFKSVDTGYNKITDVVDCGDI
jgi:hypothetical protein